MGDNYAYLDPTMQDRKNSQNTSQITQKFQRTFRRTFQTSPSLFLILTLLLTLFTITPVLSTSSNGLVSFTQGGGIVGDTVVNNDNNDNNNQDEKAIKYPFEFSTQILSKFSPKTKILIKNIPINLGYNFDIFLCIKGFDFKPARSVPNHDHFIQHITLITLWTDENGEELITQSTVDGFGGKKARKSGRNDQITTSTQWFDLERNTTRIKQRIKFPFPERRKNISKQSLTSFQIQITFILYESTSNPSIESFSLTTVSDSTPNNTILVPDLTLPLELPLSPPISKSTKIDFSYTPTDYHAPTHSRGFVLKIYDIIPDLETKRIVLSSNATIVELQEQGLFIRNPYSPQHDACEVSIVNSNDRYNIIPDSGINGQELVFDFGKFFGKSVKKGQTGTVLPASNNNPKFPEGSTLEINCDSWLIDLSPQMELYHQQLSFSLQTEPFSEIIPHNDQKTEHPHNSNNNNPLKQTQQEISASLTTSSPTTSYISSWLSPAMSTSRSNYTKPNWYSKGWVRLTFFLGLIGIILTILFAVFIGRVWFPKFQFEKKRADIAMEAQQSYEILSPEEYNYIMK
jgi:hypothetical protein